MRRLSYFIMIIVPSILEYYDTNALLCKVLMSAIRGY